MRLEDIHLPIGRSTFKFWQLALRNMRGWDDAQIEKWADQFRSEVNDEHNLLFHYLPARYVALLCVNEHIQQKLLERCKLDETVREIAECMNDLVYPDLVKGKGWDKARVRVEAVIQKLGLE